MMCGIRNNTFLAPGSRWRSKRFYHINTRNIYGFHLKTWWFKIDCKWPIFVKCHKNKKRLVKVLSRIENYKLKCHWGLLTRVNLLLLNLQGLTHEPDINVHFTFERFDFYAFYSRQNEVKSKQVNRGFMAKRSNVLSSEMKRWNNGVLPFSLSLSIFNHSRLPTLFRGLCIWGLLYKK